MNGHRDKYSFPVWKTMKTWVRKVSVTDLETLLPHDTLDAWFFSLEYSCEEGTAGGDEGGGRESSRSSWDDIVFWRDIQVS